MQMNRRLFLSSVAALGVIATLPTAPAFARTVPLASGMLDVRDFGAIGNSVADDTLAFQRAIVAARRLGKHIWCGEGTYYLGGPIGG